MMKRGTSSSSYTPVAVAEEDSSIQVQEAVPVVIPVLGFTDDLLQRDLVWNDDYFAGNQGIVAVFDVDMDGVQDHHLRATSAAIAMLAGYGAMFALIFWGSSDNGTGIYFFVFLGIIISSLTGVTSRLIRPCVESRPPLHVAITQTGVHYVREPTPKRQGCVVRIPFSDVRDVVVRFSDCNRSIMTVDLLTASANEVDYLVSGIPDSNFRMSTQATIQLTIEGLLEPYIFKKRILSMKPKNADTEVEGTNDEENEK
jgi:hypothetical protein